MNIPENLRYAASHEWILVEGDTGTVGITDHAAVVESVKAASDIYSPVTGEVIERNEAIEADPALLNTDPFGQGWIYKIRLSDPAELAALNDAAGYRAQIGG